MGRTCHAPLTHQGRVPMKGAVRTRYPKDVMCDLVLAAIVRERVEVLAHEVRIQGLRLVLCEQ